MSRVSEYCDIASDAVFQHIYIYIFTHICIITLVLNNNIFISTITIFLNSCAGGIYRRLHPDRLVFVVPDSNIYIYIFIN